jgi:soluble lytic murein transglycosylase-like protein
MIEAILLEQAAFASSPYYAHVTDVRKPFPSWAKPVTSQCIVQEAKRQKIEVIKLLSVMKVESGKVGQTVRNTNGTYDMGPMQVNSIHLPSLSRRFGVSPQDLAAGLIYDGCFNVAVGAMILRQKTNDARGDFWYGIGRYHSATPGISERYILRVHKAMTKISVDVARSGERKQDKSLLYPVVTQKNQGN